MVMTNFHDSFHDSLLTYSNTLNLLCVSQVCRVIGNPKVSADIARRIAPCFGDKKHKEVRPRLVLYRRPMHTGHTGVSVRRH